MKIKTIIQSTLIALIAATTLSSCKLSATAVDEPAKPDPVKILQGQVHSEKQLRIETEIAMTDEVQLRKRWESTTVALGILCVIGFFAGTAIGSKANRHASVSS